MPADLMKPWRQMEQIKRDGLARSIGVSNFSSKALKTILDNCEVSHTTRAKHRAHRPWILTRLNNA